MRGRKKPESASATPQPATTNGPASEVFSLAEAANYLRLSEKDVVRMIREQDLPARQVGSEWRFLKTAVQHWLSSSSSSLSSNKNAWLALTGIWKDDPYVEDEMKEIYRQRRQPRTEDNS
jgi:excisionase family DNA binding protein